MNWRQAFEVEDPRLWTKDDKRWAQFYIGFGPISQMFGFEFPDEETRYAFMHVVGGVKSTDQTTGSTIHREVWISQLPPMLEAACSRTKLARGM